MSQWGKLDYVELAGTATANPDGTTVVCSTGSFTDANVKAGDALLISNVAYRVARLVSANTITLDTVYTGASTPPAPQTFNITVVNDGGGNVFVVDGVNKPVLNLVRGGVYTFDQSAASNANHQLAFKDADGNSYTDGIVTTGTPGQAGANTVFTVPADAPSSLRYYCVAHGNYMGNTISVSTATNATGLGLAVQQSPKDLSTLGQNANASYLLPVGKRNVYGVDRVEVAAGANKANGISHTGWVYYDTYTTTQGGKRNKSEVLVAMSKNFNANATGVLNLADANDDLVIKDV